jgi:hypothetical protein
MGSRIALRKAVGNCLSALMYPRRRGYRAGASWVLEVVEDVFGQWAVEVIRHVEAAGAFVKFAADPRRAFRLTLTLTITLTLARLSARTGRLDRTLTRQSVGLAQSFIARSTGSNRSPAGMSGYSSIGGIGR